MPNNLTLFKKYTSLLDEVYQNASVTSMLDMNGAMVRMGTNANEIVVPIIIMAYLSTGSLVEMNDLSALHTLLVQNGWTWVTAVCTMLFSLMHWPCSTTCITIRKESQSWKWTAAAFALPTAAGLASCALVANGARLVGRLLGG